LKRCKSRALWFVYADTKLEFIRRCCLLGSFRITSRSAAQPYPLHGRMAAFHACRLHRSCVPCCTLCFRYLASFWFLNNDNTSGESSELQWSLRHTKTRFGPPRIGCAEEYGNALSLRMEGQGQFSWCERLKRPKLCSVLSDLC
jgi:hypothetical protein